MNNPTPAFAAQNPNEPKRPLTQREEVERMKRAERPDLSEMSFTAVSAGCGSIPSYAR